jgi:membrane-bound metal-dependent hydrolase YbcI (DUF457 family)
MFYACHYCFRYFLSRRHAAAAIFGHAITLPRHAFRCRCRFSPFFIAVFDTPFVDAFVAAAMPPLMPPRHADCFAIFAATPLPPPFAAFHFITRRRRLRFHYYFRCCHYFRRRRQRAIAAIFSAARHYFSAMPPLTPLFFTPLRAIDVTICWR